MNDSEELLAALDPQQQEVALQVSGPLCVRAGAGTGKTRAITYRIAYGVRTQQVDPRSLLAVTFTSRAAAEMRSRLRGLGVGSVQARTFHAAALRQLSYFWPRAFSGSMPNIVQQKASLVAAAARRVGVHVDKSLVRDLSAEIEWAKVTMAGVDGYQAAIAAAARPVPGDLSTDDFLRVYDAFEQAKTERQVIDFEDVLTLTCGILSENEDVAGQVRAQYRSFVVDEYQDVSPLQQHLLDLWRGGRRDICVVGDVAQTIYSFTGATPRYLVDFPQQFPGARMVELVRDYRSSPQIVATANRVLGMARGSNGLGAPRGLEGAVRLVSQTESGPAVEFRDYDSDDVEAGAVAARIKELRDGGVSLGDMAVLYRTNAQSEAYEKALGALGISVQIFGGARFFEREEVRKAVVMLRQVSRAAALAEPATAKPGLSGSDPAGSDPADSDATDSGAEATSLPTMVESVLTSIGWTQTPPKAAGAARDRWENLDALVGLARAKPELTMEQFVAELQERAQAQAAPTVNSVTLSTLHAAKGLEWEAVFLVGACEGLLPISLAEEPAAIEEERRLLYVGITRAKRILHVSYARARSGGRAQRRKVSRFLAPLWPADERPARGGAASALSARQRIAADKHRFAQDADPATQALFEQLKAWRLTQARERSIPAYSVMPDTTLRDIAVAKPKTLRQLGALRGIGAVRLSDYGAEILRCVREGTAADT